MKIGFLGGSFDPVHFGHLLAAQDACEQCRLDRLILVPAAQAPNAVIDQGAVRVFGWNRNGPIRALP